MAAMLDPLDVSDLSSEIGIEILATLRAELLIAITSAPFLGIIASDPDIATSSRTVLEERIRSHEQLKVVRANRLCHGVTVFNYHSSPSCDVPEVRYNIGIRIEVFNRTSRRFDDPYYVIFNPPNPDKPIFKVVGHTVKPAILLDALAAQYLSHFDKEVVIGEERIGELQNFVKFAVSLRRELIGWQRRREALQELREAYNISATWSPLPRTRTIIESIEYTDAQEREMKITWHDGKVGRMEILNCGRIEKATVVDGKGKRNKRLEEILEAGKITDLPCRLRP